MLHSGDFDLMKPLFKMYMDALPLARYRTMKYYGHAGCFFPETMYFWGTYCNGDYGWNREDKPDGLTDNLYIRYYWQGSIELLAMMQDYYDFTRDGTFLNETLLPFASEIVTFYSQHYPKDQDGKILFEPSQSIETFWEDVTNPLPEIAGLRFVLSRLLQLEGIDAAFAGTCRRTLAEMPETPVGEKDSRKVLLPALRFQQKRHNVENPELYAVFPYRLYGVGKPSQEIAGYSYDHRINKISLGWHQDAIQAALLGKTEEAATILKRNFNIHKGFRFPAFWGADYDWPPDQCHGGVAVRALQNMLIQTEGDDILLFPAWPKEWDVKFKVWAPGQTSVEGELKNGELLNLKVVPESRKKDVQIM
jgi:hypothetical protein